MTNCAKIIVGGEGLGPNGLEGWCAKNPATVANRDKSMGSGVSSGNEVPERMPTLDWRAMGRIWMKPARFKVRDGFLTTFPPRMNQGSGISEQSQHAPRTLLNRCSQSCGPAGRQESPGL